MARMARKIIPGGIYHVMNRGINKQDIFEEKSDYERYYQILLNTQKTCGCVFHAWCLMNNHVHLLIQPGKATLSEVMKRINISYAQYYNLKYNRTGHLFQDRYVSENIDGDAYFLMALRYIHMNPVSAGICPKPENYLYSSYREFIGKTPSKTLVDPTLALGMISVEELKRYTLEKGSEKLQDIRDGKDRLTDAEAKEVLARISGCDNVTAFQVLPKDQKKLFIQKLLEAGLSVTQISRLTGEYRQKIYRSI